MSEQSKTCPKDEATIEAAKIYLAETKCSGCGANAVDMAPTFECGSRTCITGALVQSAACRNQIIPQNRELEKQLAHSEAANARLREALEKIRAIYTESHSHQTILELIFMALPDDSSPSDWLNQHDVEVKRELLQRLKTRFQADEGCHMFSEKCAKSENSCDICAVNDELAALEVDK